MTITRIAQVVCERCSRKDELLISTRTYRDMPTRGGPRNVKPVGWGRIWVSVKTALDKPVEIATSVDLCPECVKDALAFISKDQPA